MANAEKTVAVAEITDAFRDSSAAVLTEYRGLTVAQLKELRRSLAGNATYAVVKNTLTRIAMQDAGLPDVSDRLTGPTAIAFVTGDPVTVAKGLRDFARTNPLLVLKGGVLDGRLLTAEEVRKLADLESREVLLARMAGALKASMSQAVALFAAPLAQVARLGAALAQKAEEDPSVLPAGAGTPVASDDGGAGGDAITADVDSAAPSDSLPSEPAAPAIQSEASAVSAEPAPSEPAEAQPTQPEPTEPEQFPA